MGHVVKSIFGGGSKKESSTQTNNSTQNSLLWNNSDYRNASNSAMGEISKLNIPSYQLAGLPDQERAALEKAMQGQNYDLYNTASQQMRTQGQSQYEQGSQRVNQSADLLDRLQNLSQGDYQKMLASEENTDLVNQNIAQLKQDVNETTMQNLHGIDQGATSTGNVGSSRAGVMQGVAIGQGAKAVASGSLQYRTQEEQLAQNRLMSYLNLQSNAATTGAQIGTNQMNTGLNMFGTGMNYYGQYNAGQMQNVQNAVNAGNVMRAYNQQQIDVNRQNALMSQSPSLTRLAYANQYLLPMAQLSQTSNGTVTNTQYVPQKGMLSGLMGMGGMALGNYLSGPNASDETVSQNMQLGGMMGSLGGSMFSS